MFIEPHVWWSFFNSYVCLEEVRNVNSITIRRSTKFTRVMSRRAWCLTFARWNWVDKDSSQITYKYNFHYDFIDCSDNNGACGENEVCKDIKLTFTSVARCECEDGYRRIEYWDPCISSESFEN